LHNPIPRKSYSVSKKLKEENKTNDLFEIQLSNLTLEEVIALKLELATKEADGKLYGIPIWNNLHYIVKDACLKAAISGANTRRDAARFLGISYSSLKISLRKYNVFHYFINKP
jgi:hypothetical protein